MIAHACTGKHMNMYNVDTYLEFIDTYNFYFTQIDFLIKFYYSYRPCN